jgi:ubiquinone/menaquinone biosynthesis C-methylase UbiE
MPKDRVPHEDPLGHFMDPDAAEHFEHLARTQLRHSYPMMACMALAAYGKKEGKCLELSCGTGWLAIELARRSGMEILATDSSEEMLRYARKNIKEAGLEDRITVKSMEMPGLKVPAGSFDLIVSLRSFHHYPEPDEVLKKAYRALRKGGLIYIEDTNRGVDVDIAADVAENIEDDEARERFITSLGHGYTVNEVQAMLIIAGLEDNSCVAETVWGDNVLKTCRADFRRKDNPYSKVGPEAAAVTLTIKAWKP